MYDIIIIGAGPAGLTAGIYAKRAMKKVLILEANNYGGQIINTANIANYPSLKTISGFDYATNLYNQVKDLKVDICFEKVQEIKNGKIKKVITNKNIYKCKAIILATGLINRKLNLINEDQFIGHGISYCATCDGAFYKDKDVMVVGGGNTACEEALYLADIAKVVYLVHRRDTLKADLITINLLKKKKNVILIYNSNITELKGNNNLDAVVVTNLSGQKKTFNIDGLFVAIGKTPSNESFKDLVALSKDGYILSKKDVYTNRKGIFVAGDIREKKLRQLVTATSDGAIAAYEAVEYIKNME